MQEVVKFMRSISIIDLSRQSPLGKTISNVERRNPKDRRQSATWTQAKESRHHNEPPLPSYREYADNVDFFCNNEADAKRITNIVEKILMKFNLYLKQSKTEIITYQKNAYLKKVKNLGTILSWRRQLASKAMTKYRKMWKNNFISSKKIMSWNT